MSSVAQEKFLELQRRKAKDDRKRGIEEYQKHFGDKEGKEAFELALKLIARHSRAK